MREEPETVEARTRIPLMKIEGVGFEMKISSPSGLMNKSWRV